VNVDVSSHYDILAGRKLGILRKRGSDAERLAYAGVRIYTGTLTQLTMSL
jgi:hypothetical protein